VYCARICDVYRLRGAVFVVCVCVECSCSVHEHEQGEFMGEVMLTYFSSLLFGTRPHSTTRVCTTRIACSLACCTRCKRRQHQTSLNLPCCLPRSHHRQQLATFCHTRVQRFRKIATCVPKSFQLLLYCLLIPASYAVLTHSNLSVRAARRLPRTLPTLPRVYLLLTSRQSPHALSS
jgi:hypothetical protein